MRGLSVGATLELREAVDELGPVDRALALAAAVEPPAAVEELAALPLGRRDARLLRLRVELGGERLDATAACPECGEHVELELDAAELLAREAAPVPEPVRCGGFVLEWRPPDSRDVAAAAAAQDADAAARVLLARCVSSAVGPGGAVAAVELPGDVRAAVSEAMADADPLAEVLLDLDCPACGRSFVADVDIAEFVWAELEAQAERLLRDVDCLARAYGWTEEEVLRLAPRRRAAYLRLARGSVA